MRRIVFAILLLSTPVLAQQQLPSAAEQALGTKLMQEIQVGLNCSANSIALQADLAKANAKIKEFETKAEKPKE